MSDGQATGLRTWDYDDEGIRLFMNCGDVVCFDFGEEALYETESGDLMPVIVCEVCEQGILLSPATGEDDGWFAKPSELQKRVQS